MTTQSKIDVLKIFANDKRLILYRPEWRAFTGSVLSTILLQQILYWWDKMGRKPFYKFKEPCGNKLYTEGDSWIEELGFSRTEFDTALKKIGVKVSAKNPPNPKSNHLVEYWTDINRVTYYTINAETLEKVLTDLYVNQESYFMQGGNPALHVNQESCFTQRGNPDLQPPSDILAVSPIKSDVFADSEKARKPPTETTFIKKTTDNNPNFSTQKPTLPKPASPPSAVFSKELTNLVIEKNQSPMVNKLIEQELKTHSVEYIKSSIYYANANAKKNYKAFLGKTITNGWAEGYDPEAVTVKSSEDEKYRIFLESRRQMPTSYLKMDAENGCKASAQVLKERAERAATHKDEIKPIKQAAPPVLRGSLIAAAPKETKKSLSRISFDGIIPAIINGNGPRPTA